MEPQADPVKDVLGELFTLLEAQETQSAAVLQFLKDQGIATEEKLAPYLEQAGNGSSVKWRAARMRMEYLLTPVQKEATTSQEEHNKVASVSPEPVDSKEADQHKNDKNKDQDAEKQETEMAASMKVASVGAVSKAENASGEKAEKPAK